jgi:hypothetical protein
VSQAGRPYTPQRTYKAYKAIVRRLGWPWLTLRTIRTLVATQVARTGDVLAVNRMLGHGSMEVSRGYMQDDEPHKDRGVTAMEGFLAGDGASDGAAVKELAMPPAGGMTKVSQN